METLTTTGNVVWQKRVVFFIYKSLPGEIATGCMNTPQLGQRFCNLHDQDHQELDKHAVDVNLEDASKEFGGALGPLLRSAKKKAEQKQWAQVDRIVGRKSLRKKKFYKVSMYGCNNRSLILDDYILKKLLFILLQN